MTDYFIQYYQYSLLHSRLLIPIPSWEAILPVDNPRASLGKLYIFAATNAPHCYCTAIRLFKGEPFGKSQPAGKIKLIEEIL